ASAARWQGHHYFFTDGITWSAVANHVPVKARYQASCVFDADSMRLTPFPDVLDPLVFLALLNSDVVSFFKMRFIKHTQKWEIGDLRTLPIVIPTKAHSKHLRQLAEHAIAAKRLSFAKELPDQTLVAYVRRLTEKLNAEAPVYLRPSPQLSLVRTADDCLGVIELSVSWEAEKLYNVEGLGPFNEF